MKTQIKLLMFFLAITTVMAACGESSSTDSQEEETQIEINSLDSISNAMDSTVLILEEKTNELEDSLDAILNEFE